MALQENKHNLNCFFWCNFDQISTQVNKKIPENQTDFKGRLSHQICPQATVMNHTLTSQQTGFNGSSIFTFTSLRSISCLCPQCNVSENVRKRVSGICNCSKRKCQNWSKMGCDWEKVTHLTIMLGGGPYSAGSDSVLENMVPFGDITGQHLASLNVLLCSRLVHQNYNDINQGYLVGVLRLS